MKVSHLNKNRVITLVAAVFLIFCWFQFSSSSLSYETANEVLHYSQASKLSEIGRTDAGQTAHPEKGTKNLVSIVDESVKDQSASSENTINKAKTESEKDIYSAVIMPKMPDLEAKQELGRVSWKYFHTLLARFPEEPTEAEREKLNTFLHLFAELYPCGECSYHFVELLKKYPPQTSSRITAALWGCHIHNVVNDFLGKKEYDCSTILEDYDCGCGDEEEKEREQAKTKVQEIKSTGAYPAVDLTDSAKVDTPSILNKEKGSTITLEKEGKQGG